MPHVSILVAAYNCQRYIREAIESLLSQSYRDLEVIAVDDGSTDKTWEVLSSYGDNNRVHLIHQNNMGPGAAYNSAWRIARGEFIALLDGDDLYWPDKIKRQVDFLENCPGVGLVGTQARLVTEEGKPFGVLEFPTSEFDIRKKMWQGKFGPNSAFCGASVMMRNECVGKVGGWWNEVYRFPQDADIIIRISENYPIANLPEVLYDYRIHGRQLSNMNIKKNAILSYSVKVAARFRRDNKPVPHWCNKECSREELERIGESLFELDCIEFGSFMHMAELWSLSMDWIHAADAAEAAFLLASNRGLGVKYRKKALGVSLVAWLLSAQLRKVIRAFQKEKFFAFVAVLSQMYNEALSRLHQLRYWRILRIKTGYYKHGI